MMLERQIDNVVCNITNNNNGSSSISNILDHYEIHDTKLGEGGFAKVRRGTHKQTGRQVAIKCFNKMKLADELPRVYTEIKILKRLRHPNIAQLYEVFETSSSIYLILELCSGGELFDYIVSKSKLDEVEANRIFYDLIRVLDYIHMSGIAHRDLKPENVLFDASKQVKLIDFGLAADCSSENLIHNKEQRPMDKLSTCCGSVTYAAPEVISGKNYSGTSVDVWSAGVLLYALVVGQLPFNDPSIPVLYKLIQTGLVKVPSFLSLELADLIRQMLNTNPKERITIRQILLHPWLTKFSTKQQLLLTPRIRPPMSLENRTFRRLQFNKTPKVLGETQSLNENQRQLHDQKPQLIGQEYPVDCPQTASTNMAQEPQQFQPRSPAVRTTAVTTNFNHYYNQNQQYLSQAPIAHKLHNRVCNVYRTPTKASRADALTAIQRSPMKTPVKQARSSPHKTPFKTPAKLKYGPAGKKSMIKQWLQLWTPSKLKNPRKVLVASVKHFP